MKENQREKQRKGLIRDIIFLGIILIIAVILVSIFPNRREAVITASKEFFIEMIIISIY